MPQVGSKPRGKDEPSEDPKNDQGSSSSEPGVVVVGGDEQQIPMKSETPFKAPRQLHQQAEDEGFQESDHEPVVELSAEEAAREERSNRLYPVRPRRTLLRTRICGEWYNFVQGKEQLVPGYVRDWLFEKGIL